MQAARMIPLLVSRNTSVVLEASPEIWTWGQPPSPLVFLQPRFMYLIVYIESACNEVPLLFHLAVRDGNFRTVESRDKGHVLPKISYRLRLSLHSMRAFVDGIYYFCTLCHYVSASFAFPRFACQEMPLQPEIS